LDSLRKRELIVMLLFLQDSLREREVDLVEVVASLARGFEVHERDFHAHSLMITLYGLLSFLPLSLIY